MSQVNSYPTMAQFKEISQYHGNITQNENNVLVRGSGATWFRSLFNIGNARQNNIKTIESLKNAINNDEKYKFVAADVLAKLGTMSTKFPLSNFKVRNIINRLDKNVSITKKENKNILSALLAAITKDRLNILTNKINIDCKETEHFIDLFNKRLQVKFITAIKSILTREYIDTTKPINNTEIENKILSTIGNIRSMYTAIYSSNLEDYIKEEIFIGIIPNDSIKTQEKIDKEISDYKNNIIYCKQL